ncbi:hypothetical protein B0I35DRAFT_368431 [Stachybotrys elegans]|uniref:Uncharacterized protein n=1 Tax=Stachybotrys elegans TaxID=80388 RepID=A0A8K0T3U6_9HYPO|nr:hypothetical protein B0I35DRAFT_368431 [Stachybotrys elegans]
MSALRTSRSRRLVTTVVARAIESVTARNLSWTGLRARTAANLATSRPTVRSLPTWTTLSAASVVRRAILPKTVLREVTERAETVARKGTFPRTVTSLATWTW